MLDLLLGADQRVTGSQCMLKEVLSGGRARLQILADFFGESVEIVDLGGGLEISPRTGI